MAKSAIEVPLLRSGAEAGRRRVRQGGMETVVAVSILSHWRLCKPAAFPYNQPAMRKIALVFVLAVLAPSLVLAWLALHSLRDQQFLLERQQALLYQGVTDSLANSINDYISDQEREFRSRVEAFAATTNARVIMGQPARRTRSLFNCEGNWVTAATIQGTCSPSTA